MFEERKIKIIKCLRKDRRIKGWKKDGKEGKTPKFRKIGESYLKGEKVKNQVKKEKDKIKWGDLEIRKIGW